MIDARQALERLKEGNQRFVANVRGVDAILSQVRRADFAAAQSPFAVVLGCSDSRVPAELIFDQGLGALFVVRVAGNIVAPSQLGSIEFAVERFGIALVVVIGHSSCGAVQATLDALRTPGQTGSRNMMSIVDRIRPAIQPLVEANGGGSTPELFFQKLVRANVRASASHVRHGTPQLEKLIATQSLTVVGAEYDLLSGQVDFFDGLPG